MNESVGAWVAFCGILVAMVSVGCVVSSDSVGRPAAEAFENSVGMSMVRIQAGTFEAGLRDDEMERVLGRRVAESPKLAAQFKRREVTIPSAFYCASKETTNAQYLLFLQDSDYPYAGTARGPEGIKGLVAEVHEDSAARFVGAEKPVVLVSWVDAVAFCQWLSARERRHYRLPTRVEWEYVCRAGGAGPLGSSAGSDDMGKYAWFSDNADSRTHPVGTREPNAWGIYDMHGNAAEWSSTIVAPKLVRADQEVTLAQPGVDEEMRALIQMIHEGTHGWTCGGAFSSARLSCARAGCLRVDSRDPGVGFRVVAEDW